MSELRNPESHTIEGWAKRAAELETENAALRAQVEEAKRVQINIDQAHDDYEMKLKADLATMRDQYQTVRFERDGWEQECETQKKQIAAKAAKEAP